MTSKIRSIRVSPAMIVSCVALFLALTGSALAVGLAKNSVRSPQIVDGAVRTVDLHDQAVTTPKIAPAAVGNEQLAESSVNSTKVEDQSLTESDLGQSSVGSNELQTGAVRALELGPIIQVSNTVTIKGGGNASADVACPAGTAVISGGVRGGFYQVANSGSYRSGNGWHVDSRSSANNDTDLTVYAYCLTGGSSN